jgi:hypothetical protein
VMEQDRPGRDRYPEVEREGAGQDEAERADEPSAQAGIAFALSAEQKLPISEEHRAFSRSALSADQR